MVTSEARNSTTGKRAIAFLSCAGLWLLLLLLAIVAAPHAFESWLGYGYMLVAILVADYSVCKVIGFGPEAALFDSDEAIHAKWRLRRGHTREVEIATKEGRFVTTWRRKMTRKLILRSDPRAFDAGTLLGRLESHEARLASDPDIQRRRAESIAAGRREMLPFRIGSVVFIAAGYAACAWFLPGLLEPLDAALLAIVTCAMVWAATR